LVPAAIGAGAHFAEDVLRVYSSGRKPELNAMQATIKGLKLREPK
jgi:hypothetical protein